MRKKPRLLTLPQPVILAVRMSMMMIHSLALNMNVIGMVSHKMSKITIFGHKHLHKSFHQKIDIIIWFIY